MLIIGHARHGKDTVAQILKDGWGLEFCSSSYAAAEKVVFPVLAPIYGYETIDECYTDRVNHRAEWKDLITAYNSPDKTRLAREIMEKNDIYVGMRCYEELEACVEDCIFSHVVWVDGCYRKDPEPYSSNTIPANHQYIQHYVENNGSIHDLVLECFKLMKTINRNCYE